MDSDLSASPLTMSAIAMHETYVEFRAAGFTKDEALTLIVKMVKDG
jgi:hypothetical protein